MIQFDHLAVASATLAQGNSYLEAATGLLLPNGGQHPHMGTHNLLTSFSPDTYLEVISTNPDAPKPTHPRWFGLDDPQTQARFPALISWVVRTDDIDAAVATATDLGIDYGTPTALSRGNLSWRFAIRKDGAIPLDGAAPNIIQWDSPHPAQNMTDLGLRFDHLQIGTPHSDPLKQLLTALKLDTLPDIQYSKNTHLTATLVLTSGEKVLLQ